ncbi:MAG: ABC transporter ATP-binding protein [Candidatus Methanomethylophilaceae archaeon]|nr:ABC transporter ATP-binding protein [Candidatus Methanomethylophilaceae archaeon]
MILKYLSRKQWALVCVMAAFVTMQVWLDLEIPGYMSEITVLLGSGGATEEIVGVGVEMVLCSLGSVVCSLCAGGVAAYVAAGFAETVRRIQFSKVQSFSPEEMGRFSTYSLITRSTNDITQVQLAVARTSQLVVKVPVMTYIALGKIATGSWEWTELTAVGIVAIIIVQSFMLFYVIPRYRRVQRYTDGMNRVVRESMTGVRVIRAFNAEAYQNAKADTANDELTDNNLFASRLLAFTRPFNGVVQNMLTVAIYWSGAVIIMGAASSESALFTFSNMIVFSSYAMYVVSSFILLAHIAMGLPRAIVSAQRIEEVIDTDLGIGDGEGAEPVRGDVHISFRGVSFTYAGGSGPVLSDVDLDIMRGETLAVIGQTGSGKTTLVNLIPRLFDATSGTVEVDGSDVRDYRLSDLRSRLGYATQKPVIFSGTVGYNIAYGSGDVPESEVLRAAGIAQLDGYLSENDGLDTEIQQKGANLSGGQKQRISIARAVCRRPEIYIFDDSFSALDFRTDIEVRRALRRETSGATTVIVSQRIGTVRDADRIVVLSEGRVAGIGTHDELMEGCGVYREMAESQIPREAGT